MIRQRRVALGIRQRVLATRACVSDAYITPLETREYINPTLAVLKQLAKAFKVMMGELLQ
jgi:predicted transcriptional regulator